MPDLPTRSAFPLYLASSSLWLGGMSIQGFLIPWLLVGILKTPADLYSFSRVLMELPPMAVLLVGGIFADRMDSRRLLIGLSIAVAIPPLILAGVVDHLAFWPIVTFGIAMALVQAISDPARQAMMSRVTRTDIQRTVTLTTVVTSFVGLGGMWLGGQLDTIGLERVLLLQAAFFLVSVYAVYRLPPMPPQATLRPRLTTGIRAVWRIPLVRNIIGLNFTSGLFNAGAYIVGIPFIVTQVYGGGAEFFAYVMIAFTAGSVGSNVILFLVMPLVYPGRVYLLLQLTRVVILGLLWLQPPVWLFFVLMFMWGVNMGVTSTLVRTTVQELAPAAERAQVLAILLLTFMVGSPISTVILGTLIAATDPLTGLLPGIPVSLAIFAVGVLGSGLWQFKSPSASDRSVTPSPEA
ncbi:MAG: MFS transporter [Gammaproteobacteria bacterium]|nr:MFS transporter [Gammaproteobacteria bacterium]